MSKESVFENLKNRGFIFQTTNEEGLKKYLETPGGTIYQGFDPTAESLHLGHLMSLVAMHKLQKAGHKIIFLLGGGTGRVGDPTDKSTARTLLSQKEVKRNGQKIKNQVEKMGLVRFSGETPALMLNNNEWLSRFKFLEDFMMEVAKTFSVNDMVKIKTFANRLKENENLSLMEFCYPVMQAWDFLVLFENQNCRLQIGGQDQWVNILQGVELIRRKHRKEAFGLTFPLLTTSSGQKMGKTEKGAVWLNPQQTTPFDFYQYLISVPDELVEPMLKLLTFISLEEIEKVIKKPKEAQETLAFEVTKIVHGEEEARRVQKDSKILFEEKEGQIKTIPTFEIPKNGMALDDILTKSTALPSKSEARRRVEGGAVQIEEKKIKNPKKVIKTPCVIKYGKDSFLQIKIKK